MLGDMIDSWEVLRLHLRHGQRLLIRGLCGWSSKLWSFLGSLVWEFLEIGGPALGSFCEGSYSFESILGAPDFWKLPYRDYRALLKGY